MESINDFEPALIPFANGTKIKKVYGDKPLTYDPEAPLVHFSSNAEVFEHVEGIPVLGENSVVEGAAKKQLYDYVRQHAWWLRAEKAMDEQGLRGSNLQYEASDTFMFSNWLEEKRVICANVSSQALGENAVGCLEAIMTEYALYAPIEFQKQYDRLLLFDDATNDRAMRNSPRLFEGTIGFDVEYINSISDASLVTNMFRNYVLKLNDTLKGTKRNITGHETLVLERCSPLERSLPMPVAIDVR